MSETPAADFALPWSIGPDPANPDKGYRLLLGSVARILMADQAPAHTTGLVLEAILQAIPWEVCALWQTSPSTPDLTLTAIQAPPSAPFQAFMRTSRSRRFPVEGGLLRRVDPESRPVWFLSSQQADFPRRADVQEAGFHTGLAIPIALGGRILGICECYARQSLPMDSDIEAVLEAIGMQLAQFLDRKRLQEDLFLREDQLGIILGMAPALISYVGTDLRYRFVSRTFESWFGKSRNELIGMRVQDVVSKEGYAVIQPRLEEVFQGRELILEATVPYKDGTSRFVRSHYIPHIRKDGGLEGIMVFIVNLTDRKRMEDSLRESEKRQRESAERLAIIYNNMNEIAALISVEGNSVFRMLEANEYYMSRSKIPRDKVHGRLVSENMPPEAYAFFEAKMRQAVDSRTTIVYEANTVTLREKSIHELRLTPIVGASGEVTHLLLVGKDLTQLRKKEEELRQSQKMEAVGRLAGGIAHDFNNLLTAINGFAELAIASLTDPKRVKEMLEEVRRCGDRAADLTRQLLAFSRKQILFPTVIDLNATVAGMGALLHRLIGEDVELATSLDPQLNPVRMDAGQLEQIILNLALNGRDAMPHGGKLEMETRKAELTASDASTFPELVPGTHALLAVTDSGTGMSAETQQRMFEPFFTTKDPGKGTGMGMATVYGIVKQSGGHILVRSELGKGTRIEVYFPAS